MDKIIFLKLTDTNDTKGGKDILLNAMHITSILPISHEETVVELVSSSRVYVRESVKKIEEMLIKMSEY